MFTQIGIISMAWNLRHTIYLHLSIGLKKRVAMPKSISIFPCGTKVKPMLLGIEGMITSVNICFDKVRYEVNYFVSGKQESIWMNESEFELSDRTKIKVGYK